MENRVANGKEYMMNNEDLEQLLKKYGSDLISASEKETLDKDFNKNYKDVLLRIRSKLIAAGLSGQIGVAPCLMDFCISDEIMLAYHRNYRIELSSPKSCKMFLGPFMSVSNFEIFTDRLLNQIRK